MISKCTTYSGKSTCGTIFNFFEIVIGICSLMIFIAGFVSISLILVDRAIKRSNCFHHSGDKNPCHMSSNPYMIIFGISQIFLSQIPNFDQIWWLSIVAAVMSFTYSIIGLSLGIAKVAGYIRNALL